MVHYAAGHEVVPKRLSAVWVVEAVSSAVYSVSSIPCFVLFLIRPRRSHAPNWRRATAA